MYQVWTAYWFKCSLIRLSHHLQGRIQNAILFDTTKPISKWEAIFGNNFNSMFVIAILVMLLKIHRIDLVGCVWQIAAKITIWSILFSFE